MKSFLQKAWAWIKKWWKLIVGFLLALGGIGVGVAIASRNTKPPTPIPPDLDDETDKTLTRIEEADRRKEQQLAELEAKNHARLSSLSEDQQREYDEVKKKPIDEVAKWIDSI